jgi:hypothetical protein
MALIETQLESFGAPAFSLRSLKPSFGLKRFRVAKLLILEPSLFDPTARSPRLYAKPRRPPVETIEIGFTESDFLIDFLDLYISFKINGNNHNYII